MCNECNKYQNGFEDFETFVEDEQHFEIQLGDGRGSFGSIR